MRNISNKDSGTFMADIADMLDSGPGTEDPIDGTSDTDGGAR